jgi:predicted  nucleic acid-binding Zn-ribbon protein
MSASERMPARQLGELMTELGLISDEQLATVLEVQQRSKRPLGQIIVELGFASGAAVAHALAMQSGGALKTEFGFALGVSPEHGDGDSDETPVGLPKLRLASTAAQPRVSQPEETPVEEPPTDSGEERDEPSEKPVALATVPEPSEPLEVEPEEPVEAIEDPVEVEPEEPVEAIEDAVETAEPDEPIEIEAETVEKSEPEPEEVPLEEVAELEAVVEVPLDVGPDTAELDELRAEIDRLGLALAEAHAAAVEQTGRQAEVERLEAALAETQAAHEQTLAGLREQHEHATSELERLQTALTEAHSTTGEQELLQAEVERLESALAETKANHEHEVARLREARDEAKTELDGVQATLVETQTTHEHELARLHEEHRQTRADLDGLQSALAGAQAEAAEHERRLAEERELHAAERSELTAQSARLEEALGSAFERLATVGPAAEERDQLRTEVEQLGTALAEAQAAATSEQERLRADVERLENVLAETRTAHGQELDRLQQEHEHTCAELERLQTALAEAQTSAADQERRLAEEQERRETEQSDLTAQRDRLQHELGATLDQLATLGPAVEERDELRQKVERLETSLSQLQENSARELRSSAEDRDRLTAELEEAHELLRQAEQVRESVIALTAERDRAVAELDQARTAAAEAQLATEEENRLLAEEQERHHRERQSLLAQRGRLEQELGSTLEELAAANSATDEREQQLQLAADRLRQALDEAHAAASTDVQRLELLRRLATELVSGPEEGTEEAEAAPEVEVEPEAATEAEPEPETAEAEEVAEETQPEEVEYSLFVPGPNGYELVPQTGVPPKAGEKVELDLPDRDEPTVFEVVRSGRPLPDGDVCVYLAQV